jgi:hypothetical protein
MTAASSSVRIRTEAATYFIYIAGIRHGAAVDCLYLA